MLLVRPLGLAVELAVMALAAMLFLLEARWIGRRE
jgi:hypothetical protein